jgi:hypothetical protein
MGNQVRLNMRRRVQKCARRRRSPDGRYPASKLDMQFLKFPPNPPAGWPKVLTMQLMIYRARTRSVARRTMDGTDPLDRMLSPDEQ